MADLASAPDFFGPPDPNGADGILGQAFGVSAEQGPPPGALAAEAQARAFTEALAFIERHQLPVSRAQAAGWTLLRHLDGGRGTYLQIVEQAERLRLLGGGAKDFVDGLQAIALASRPRLMSVGAGRQQSRGGLWGRGR
jgi:hypothetical protein